MGFKIEDYHAAVKWRDAAKADGWTSEPTYKTESEERACRLRKDGFVAHILTRTPEPKPWNTNPKHEGGVYLWGPDGLCIETPREYDFGAILAGLNKCGECKKDGVPTQRVGFAGRCCESCLPAARKKHEYPGWTN